MAQTWHINGRHMNIEELKKWKKEQALKKAEVKPEIQKESFLVKEKEEAEVKEVSELEFLKGKYEEQEEKPVPNNKKNDVEWIKSKLKD